jgi:hypothetical protein
MAVETVESLYFTRHLQDLRDTWQARVLVATQRERLGIVVLSVLAHNFDDALPVLLQAVFPGFYAISAPFLCSAGKIDKRGKIIADLVMRDNQPPRRNTIVFHSLADMQSDFRRLADRLKLDDKDRRQLFAAVKNWVVADQRLDPTMDPKDPDARRLTVH